MLLVAHNLGTNKPGRPQGAKFPCHHMHDRIGLKRNLCPKAK